MKTDVEIARAAQLCPITEIAKSLGIAAEHIEPYGRYKAKLTPEALAGAAGQNGKLILVTAINPTPAGEGKTTTSVGLADALHLQGKKTIVALREPSLGPCFGMKGGAAGGGYAQVVPMEDINLHFTGDFHAITTAHNLLAALIDADFSRIQFTPDLMPSDVLGTSVFNMKTSEFDFHRGPIFADIVLADEINRAPAKTQAALFEVMEERQATIDGTTYPMSPIYTILATQNPVEHEGTYKLPEAQLDRFLMKITMQYPTLDEEVRILERHHANRRLTTLESVQPVIAKDELLRLIDYVGHVYVEPAILRYIALIVARTRTARTVYLGASPRASVAMMQVAKSLALLHGRDFITPEDVKSVAIPVLQHRITLTAEAEMEGHNPVKIIGRLVEQVEVPK